MKYISMTYKPKIEAVRTGRCDQTIRRGRKYKVGDEVTFYAWSGSPYRSKWAWRRATVLTEVIDIRISENGISGQDEKGIFYSPWRKGQYFAMSTRWIDELAARDFIEGGTGEDLHQALLLRNKHRRDKAGFEGEYQIPRWNPGVCRGCPGCPEAEFGATTCRRMEP